jgi:hypothetical protein
MFLVDFCGRIYRLHPPHPITESRLCMLLLEGPENEQFHVTCLIFQLTLSFIIFQTAFHCLFMMKQNYNNPIHVDSQKSECIHVSAAMQVFLCDCRKGNILLQMKWEGFAFKQGTKNFPCNLLKTTMLSLFCPSVKRLEYL